MKRILMIVGILTLAACTNDPGSEKWCVAQGEMPKSDWTGSDAATYAKNCLIDGMAVGSEDWCEDLNDKPKGEWTGDEAKAYAKKLRDVTVPVSRAGERVSRRWLLLHFTCNCAKACAGPLYQ